MRDVTTYGKECINELKTMGIDTGRIPKDIGFKTSRAKSRFGQCKTKLRNGIITDCEINISSFMLDEDILEDDRFLKQTIIHELLHSMTPNEHHGGEWKRLADKVTRKSNGKYVITRANSFEELGIDRKKVAKPKKIRYQVACPQCGATWNYQRKSKVVNNPENYRCAGCKKTLVRVPNSSL